MSQDEDEHRSRRMLLNYLREHPGVGRQELSRVLQIQESTLRYHLARMEKGGAIKVVKENGHPRFFCRYLDVPSDMLEKGRLSLDQVRLFRFIRENPGSTRMVIMRNLPKGNGTISEDLRVLVRKRLVSRSGKGKEALYFPVMPDEMRTQVLKSMIEKLVTGEIDEPTFLRLKEELDRRFNQ
jgi:predicted transcriptional regulator